MTETGDARSRGAPVCTRLTCSLRIEQTGRPCANGREGVGLIGVAEELRQDRVHGYALRVEGIHTPMIGGDLQETETLRVVGDYRVGEQGPGWVGKAAGHIWEVQGRLVDGRR